MIARPWTDDLPKCGSTSVGQLVNKPGSNSEPNEDPLSFCCKVKDNTCLYGVFEPHNGVEASRFLMQRMAAEILFQPLSDTSTDEEVMEILRNSFVSVEKAYIENYDGIIAERSSLQYQLQTLNDSEMSTNYDTILGRLKEIDQHLAGGATVVIALVHNSKLFVANVGEARALLCRTDDNSVLRVVQLSVDHNLNNEDELLRLSQLGLEVNKLRNAQYLGNQPGTRCLGNYLVKGVHGAFPSLRRAAAAPVCPAPDLCRPHTLDHHCRFLVLVSAGVYKRIQKVKGCYEQTNKILAQLIVEGFRKTKDLNSLSQSVLNEIENEFLNYCVENNLTPKRHTHMTLLIRNFNFPMPNVPQNSLTQQESNLAPKQQNTSVRFNPIVQSKSNTLLNEIDSDYSESNRRELTNMEDSNANSNPSIDSTSDVYPKHRFVDRNQRIKGYVDFSCYYENVEKARKNGTLPSFIK